MLLSSGSQGTLLTKKHTLKLQALLPITGNAAPLGDLCIKPIEYLLAKINNQSKILPDYNLVVDVADDQCSGSTGLQKILPFFFADRVLNQSSAKIGDYHVPKNYTMNLESAETFLVPPILAGSLCSGVCQIVGQQMQIFNLIELTSGCNSEAVSDNKKYPNLYRAAADSSMASTTVKFIVHLNWDYVALLSDSSKMNLKITEEVMVGLQNNNVTVAGVEVFISDPKESVLRITEKGVRVIAVNCFFDLCPLVACEAYKAGFYGDRVVWLFPGGVDLVKSNVPVNCTEENMKELKEKSFVLYFPGIANKSDSDYSTSDISVDVDGLDEYLKSQVPGVENASFYNFRRMCISATAPSIFMLDEMEKRLNIHGSSLAEMIADPAKQQQLMELAIQAIQSIKINIFGVLLDFDGDRVNVEPPSGYYQYVDDEFVYIYKTHGINEIKEIKWWTVDGKKPKARSSFASSFEDAGNWEFILMSILYSISFVGIVILCFIDYKTKVMDGDSYSWSRQVVFIGIMFHSVPVICQPIYGTKLQCSVAPVFISIGYYLQVVGIFSRIVIIKRVPTAFGTFVHRMTIAKSTIFPINIPNVPTKKSVQLRKTVLKISGFLINILLLAVWYYENRPVAHEATKQSYDEEKDEITEYYWYQCNSSIAGTFPISAILLFALHCLISIAVLFKAIYVKGIIAPATFVLVTSHLAAFLITTILAKAYLNFLTLAIIFLISNTAMCCIFLPEGVLNRSRSNLESRPPSALSVIYK